MEATAQLNARMPKSLKKSGDEALALIGLSPTQAVRALWEKASRRGEDLDEVAKLLCGSGLDDRMDGSVDDAVAESWTIAENVLASYGLACERPDDMPDDKELLEDALRERLAERGLA